MIKKVTVLLIFVYVVFCGSVVWALAPKGLSRINFNVDREVLEFSELMINFSKVDIKAVDQEYKERLEMLIRSSFLPSLSVFFEKWGVKLAKDDNGAFIPMKINSLIADKRRDYNNVKQNKITISVVNKKGDTFSIIYNPQNTKRDPHLGSPQAIANYISVFDKDNRKVSLRKFLYCQKEELPLETLIPELGFNDLPVLPIPGIVVSRIGGEDGVSCESINRIKQLLNDAEAMEKEGKIAAGYKIHIITGDYEKNSELEEYISKGRLSICNIPNANPDKKIPGNQELFYAMFGINSESEKEEFVKEIAEREEQLVKLQHRNRKININIDKVLSGDAKKDLLDKLYQQSFKNMEKMRKLTEELEEKKRYFKNKGKKTGEKALKKLLKQGNKIFAEMEEYFEDNGDIEVAILENASLPFYQAKLFIAAFKLIRENNLSSVIFSHDWPDDRVELYDFDNVVEQIQDVFLRDFFLRYPHFSYGAINERDINKYYKKRDILDVTNVANSFFAESSHKNFNRSEELKELLLGKAHKDDFVALLPVRPVGRKRLDAAIVKLGMLKEKMESEGREFKTSLIITHSEKDANPDEEIKPLKELADLFGINLVFGAEHINNYNKENPDNKFDIFDQYFIGDFVDYSSDFEGFGNALLETLYYKIPVICNRYEVFEQDIITKGFEIPNYKIDPAFKFKDFVQFLLENNSIDKKDLKNKIKNLYAAKLTGLKDSIGWIDSYLSEKDAFLRENEYLRNSGIPGSSLPDKYKRIVENNFQKLLQYYSFEAATSLLKKMIRDAIASNNIRNIDVNNQRFLLVYPAEKEFLLRKSA